MEVNMYGNMQNLIPPTDSAKEIRMLEEELVKEKDRTLRTLADFTNYRRRIERDGKKISEEGKREVILPLLDIIDDLEKALLWAGDEDIPFVKGVRNIQRKFMLLLESQGVISFETVGMPFNHELHEAIAVTECDGIEPGLIVNELRRGYLWRNELLRAAQVRVAE